MTTFLTLGLLSGKCSHGDHLLLSVSDPYHFDADPGPHP